MNELPLLQQMEHWGYYLLPKSHPDSLGYTGLLVAIREKPTGMHFDPVTLHLRLRQDEQARWGTLGLESAVEKSTFVCPGRVILRDRKLKEVEFFTFGGSLEALSVPAESVYSLRSPAPILAVTEMLESPADQFAFDTEVMLARFNAKWGLDEEGFERRLAQVTATQFYLANFHAILQRYEKSRALREQHHHFYHVLLKEKKWLEDANEWPSVPPMLETLLSPD
jgi:hypothetical protein